MFKVLNLYGMFYFQILESVTEVLFLLCNDSDSDIRSVASDCLNRIARVSQVLFRPQFEICSKMNEFVCLDFKRPFTAQVSYGSLQRN